MRVVELKQTGRFGDCRLWFPEGNWLRCLWLVWLPNSQWHRVVTGELCRLERVPSRLGEKGPYR